jgi:AcrR family transcriptional regulator
MADTGGPEPGGPEVGGPDDGGQAVAAPPLAEQAALRPTARRRQAHEQEVRRLLDAGLELFVARGTAGTVRVADIVAAAGLSNKAFYRYFASKNDLVAAIIDDGVRRCRSYLRHQIGKETDPRERLRRLVEGYLGQATDPELAAAARTVLATSVSSRDVAGPASRAALDMLTGLATEPLADLGVPGAAWRARLLALTLTGALEDILFARVPAPADAGCVAAFCLAGAGVRPDVSG